MEQANVREQLSNRLIELEDRIARVERDLRKPGDRDWTERATQLENDEVLEGLSDRIRLEIAQVKSALDRIEQGRYGICSGCGGPISKERLQAVPYGTTCMGCAT